MKLSHLETVWGRGWQKQECDEDMLEEVCIMLRLGWEAHGGAGGALPALQHPRQLAVEEGACGKQPCRCWVLLVLWLQGIGWEAENPVVSQEHAKQRLETAPEVGFVGFCWGWVFLSFMGVEQICPVNLETGSLVTQL